MKKKNTEQVNWRLSDSCSKRNFGVPFFSFKKADFVTKSQ